MSFNQGHGIDFFWERKRIKNMVVLSCSREKDVVGEEERRGLPVQG